MILGVNKNCIKWRTSFPEEAEVLLGTNKLFDKRWEKPYKSGRDENYIAIFPCTK